MKLKRTYNLKAPKGVNGRISDNTLILKYLGWEPNVRLRDGMEKPCRWIYDQIPPHKKTQSYRHSLNYRPHAQKEI